jgi:hypothetical protein
MPDANRAKPTSPRPAAPGESPRRSAEPPLDPRQALAQQYLRGAQAKLAEEEASAPRSARRAAAKSPEAGFSLSIDKSTFVHLVLVSAAITFVAVMLLLLYAFMNQNAPPGGMIAVVVNSIAIPAGVLTFAVLSYASVCYLGVVESTSRGHTDVQDLLYGGWREWFWTLPSTLGMAVIALVLGVSLSYVVPVSVWLLIGLSLALVYPVLQLSTLETGSPLAPVSLIVLRSLAERPVAWLAFYAISFGLIGMLWLLGHVAWHDPPLVTMFIMGPAVTVALFFYAWLLGQLARLISTGEKR